MPNHPDIPNRCTARIDLSAISHNVQALQSIWGENRGLMGIVKADAYGHGIGEVAGALASEVEMFGVASLAEAGQLKQSLARMRSTAGCSVAKPSRGGAPATNRARRAVPSIHQAASSPAPVWATS